MHSISYRDYSIDTSISEIEEDCKYIAERNGGDYFEDIQFSDEKYDSYAEAQTAIEKCETRSGYLSKAVKFLCYPKVESSLKATLEQRVKRLYEEYNVLENEVYYMKNPVKAKLLACKECDSKIATSFLKTNFCPVCKKDIRPASYLERIQNKKIALKNAEIALNSEIHKLEQKAKDKAKYRWLVRFEYHC